MAFGDKPSIFSRVDAGEHLELSANSTTPTQTDRNYVYTDGTSLLFWNGSSVTTLGSGGGSGAEGSLDSAYDVGTDITIDSGAITLTDATAGALNTLELVKTGAGSGNVLDLSVDAALTGNAVALDMNLGTAAVGLFIDSGATARTGSDIQFNDDSTGDHSVIDINSTGSGATVGFDFVGSFNGSPGGQVFLVDLNANDNLDTEIMQVTTGAGDRGIMFDLNFGHSDSGTTSHLWDVDVTGILDSNVFDFATTAACTGNVFFLNMDNALAMTALHIEGSGVRTQPFIELITDSTSSASLIDISVDGAITGAAAIDIDMNAGLAAAAIFIDAGAGTRTADIIDCTFDGDGNVAFLDLNNSNTGSGNLLDIVTSGVHTGNVINMDFTAAATGHFMNVDMNANLAGSFLVLDYGAGTRTEDMCQVTFDGDGTNPFWDVNISNTGAGGTTDYWDIDVSGVFTGSILDVNYSAAATGDAVVITLGSAVAAKALRLVASGARTDDVIEVNDSSTSNSSVLDINMSGAFTGNVLDIATTSTGSGHLIALNTDTGAYTGDFINGSIDSNATGAQFIVFDREGGSSATNLIDITDSTTGAGDLFSLTLDAAGSGHVFDINFSAAHTGNGVDITYGTSAATGNAIDLNMGTNVAGMAVSVSSAATGTSGEGSALDVAHTGDLVAGADLVRISSTGSPSATSNLVAIEQSTGAGTTGANALYINATGTNVEAIRVDAGNVTFDEALTVVGAATFSLGYQATATARTATADGTGTGTIADGTSFVTVTSASADNIITLPTPTPGTIVWLRNGATGYELRSSAPASVAINGGTAASAESAIGANELVRCVCDTSTTWIATSFGTDGTESAVEAAA